MPALTSASILLVIAKTGDIGETFKCDDNTLVLLLKTLNAGLSIFTMLLLGSE